MAHEAVLVIETELAIPMTCADDTGIEKGATLKLADPATVSQANGLNNVVGGIAKSEKIANDGFVKTNVYRGGIFRVYVSGSVSAGDSVGTVSSTALNYVIKNNTTANLSGSRVLGTMLEDATTGQTALMELRPQCVFTD